MYHFCKSIAHRPSPRREVLPTRIERRLGAVAPGQVEGRLKAALRAIAQDEVAAVKACDVARDR